MKIAIHHREGSFSEYWIAYCKQENIAYKLVNCYESDIIEQLGGCDALMWHHHHAKHRDVIAAKKILFALEHAKIKVFPDFKTAWHFDDKVAQKYLLEAIGAPAVPSFVFYDKNSAIQWAKNTSYPKVFKLKGGASAANVSLIKSERDALNKINQAFGRGFSQFNAVANLKERYRKYKEGKSDLLGLSKGVARLVIPTNFSKNISREKGYIYVQEFIPNNNCDTRVIIIGDKAFAIKRLVRKNDFRASGSGQIVYDRKEINLECVKIAFEVNQKIEAQSIAYDFVFDQFQQPLIVEISYGFASPVYELCEGYWDSELQWHNAKITPQQWMIEDVLRNK